MSNSILRNILKSYKYIYAHQLSWECLSRQGKRERNYLIWEDDVIIYVSVDSGNNLERKKYNYSYFSHAASRRIKRKKSNRCNTKKIYILVLINQRIGKTLMKYWYIPYDECCTHCALCILHVHNVRLPLRFSWGILSHLRNPGKSIWGS